MAKQVKLLHPVAYGQDYPRGAEIALPDVTADHLKEKGIVEILFTIEEPVEAVPDESASSESAAETAIAQTEEAPKTAKTTKKGATPSE